VFCDSKAATSKSTAFDSAIMLWLAGMSADFRVPAAPFRVQTPALVQPFRRLAILWRQHQHSLLHFLLVPVLRLMGDKRNNFRV
jgi:hypothetical protein